MSTVRRTLLVVSFLWLAATVRSPAAESQKTPDEEGRGKVQILVAYYSLRGTTEQMAKAVAEGVSKVDGAIATVRRVEQCSKEQLQAADGIVLGCPAYFANITGKMKVAIDDWNWKLKVDFTDKVGGAFATGGGQTGGKEHTVVSLILFMLNNRMLVAGPLYQDEEGDDKWGEIGASAITGPLDPGVGDGERDAARRLGERIARVTLKVKCPHGHDD
jgi:NAD(P)H dehydrogenase (quinone)